MKSTAQDKKLQTKDYQSLYFRLSEVEDGRRDQGKRYSLQLILFLIVGGHLGGAETIVGSLDWASNNRIWLDQIGVYPLGKPLPNATTVCRTLAKVEPFNLIQILLSWYQDTFGRDMDEAAGLDGKALRALSGSGHINHILNLFTHQTKLILGQIGVKTKENEITATPKLLEMSDIALVTLTGDALLTQRLVVDQILGNGGDYLLMVKGNQEELRSILEAGFNGPNLKTQSQQTTSTRKTRMIVTTVTISTDFDLPTLGFQGVQAVGKITREGTRSHKGNQNQINETTYFITSREDLTPKKAYQLIRGHWSIENNLHWQKDYTFHEDRYRLKQGTAPQIMSYLRSFLISLIKKVSSLGVTQTLRQLTFNQDKHHQFLLAAKII